MVEKKLKDFVIFGTGEDGSFLEEQFNEFKTLVKREPVRFPMELGEIHPFDSTITEGLYKKLGFINALIEKKVDHVWGRGLHVRSDNENAQAIIEQWMQDVDFICKGKQWTREAFVKPFGIIELGISKDNEIRNLKVLDAKYIYKRRDDKGNILEYNQLIKGFKTDRDLKKEPLTKGKDYITLLPKNIIEFSINKIGDDAYGLGLIYSNLDVIDSFLGMRKDLHTIMRRKAGSPYWIKMGSLEQNIFPEASAVTDMANRLTYLQAKTEWVTGPDVDIKTVDFGAISEKFKFPLDNDIDMLFYGFQTPKGEMGGQLSTGLGSGASKEWSVELDIHISSIQEELEKIIEEQLFRRVLLSNGFDDHVEIIWGEPSDTENTNRIQLLQSLYTTIVNPALRKEMERDIARLLDYDENIVDEGEEERKTEEEREQPIVPGSLSFLPKIKEWFISKKKIREFKEIKIPEDIYKDYPLIEWINFNYRKFTKDIDNVVDKDKFENLKAINEAELDIGYLSELQILKLKKAMKETFNKGLSIRTLASTLVGKDIIPPLYAVEEGEKVVRLSQDLRSILVARTETIRLSALGALENYQNNNVQKVRFTAAISTRTCPICESYNGSVYEILDIPPDAEIPIHVNCRCTWSPVVIE